MQLIPRYLVNDRINVVSNDAGFVVEYRPVYSRNLKVYRGIDNTIQFRLLNADQKPVTITEIVMMVVFDEDSNMVLERECTVTDDGSTTSSTKGMFHVTITENDLLDIKQQYLYYNIYLKSGETSRVTYSNRNFESAGIIYLNSGAYPGPKASKEVTSFYPVSNYWTAGTNDPEKISAEPGINGNNALHTIAVYTNQYVGNVEVQVTLDNQLTDFNNWTTIGTINFTGAESEPVPYNFTGVFSFIRFKLDSDPANKVSKILVRN